MNKEMALVGRFEVKRATHYPRRGVVPEIAELPIDHLTVDFNVQTEGRITIAASDSGIDGEVYEFDMDPAAARGVGEALIHAASRLGEGDHPSPPRPRDSARESRAYERRTNLAKERASRKGTPMSFTARHIADEILLLLDRPEAYLSVVLERDREVGEQEFQSEIRGMKDGLIELAARLEITPSNSSCSRAADVEALLAAREAMTDDEVFEEEGVSGAWYEWLWSREGPTGQTAHEHRYIRNDGNEVNADR